MTKFLLVATIAVLFLALCFETEAMTTKLRKRLDFIRKAQSHVLQARAASEEDDDEEYEGEGEEVWSIREDAEMFLTIFDQNSDGQMSENELWGFFETMSYSDIEIHNMIEEIAIADANFDTHLSLDEIMVAMEKSLL